jgi:hypothetical protein
MTPEQQRTAIAEACGWRIAERVSPEAKEAATACWIRPNGDEWQEENLPDYLNDLNAMHEAEKVLNEKQDHIMNDTLWDMCEGRKYLWHATAAQRAEAFLRTIGKWKEAKL